MKKCISFLICLLLVCVLAVPAMAADSIQFSMSASSQSLYRGDTVTITVKVSGNASCTQYGLKLSIDKDIYEVVSGECTVSGALIKTFDPDKGFVVMYPSDNPTVPSGTVGTFTLKVKEDAEFGSANVSGTASVMLGTESVEASGASAKLTIVCRHEYGSWSSAGDSTHKRTCSICGGTDTADHAWNSGKITKEPNCLNTGIRTYTCTACGATREEVVPKTETHTYGSWQKVNDTSHKHACTVCGKEETGDHVWNNGSITKQPDCLNTGEMTYTCQTCKGTRIEVVPKTTTHTYGQWQKVNETTHKHACTVCGKEETANHTWNSGVLTKKATCQEAGERLYTCTACSSTRSEVVPKLTTHTYGAWQKVDDNTHRHVCTVCSTAETASHTWNTGVEIKKATCQEGGVKRYTCIGCGATRDEATPMLTTHTYDNSCDTNCNVCGFTRTVTHSFKTAWGSDVSGHWHECAICYYRQDNAAHIPGPAATATTAQTCTVCGYIITPAQSHTHKYAAVATFDNLGHWYPCEGCNERSEYAEHVFDHECDADCADCGFTRTVVHSYGSEWAFDQESHWYACTVCGEPTDAELHVPGAEATVENPQLCLICGYEIAPKLVEETVAPTAPAAPGPGYNDPVVDPGNLNINTPSFPWGVVIVLVCCGGLVGVMFLHKKKR